MDAVNNWKKILLQWIKECNFLEKTFYSIDQTEIDLFFIHFKDRFKENISQNANLPLFLKEQYPQFEPHFDDENILSSSDHFYVYSLLLHFSCVLCPNSFFQENCQKLNEFAQQNIKGFFQKLLDEESLTKETLRRVIASLHVFTPPSNRFLYSADSPMKTPRKNTDISPPTPRSCMLQEKNKKVHTLKAQLETVIYEKSVLETDIKDYQDKIAKLNLQLRRAQQEIHDLKSDMDIQGNCELKHTEEEQLNRRFHKKIAQKEMEIAEQRETIESLTEQRDLLTEKQKNAEKQIKVLQGNIEDLAERLDDLVRELEKKENTIQDLSDAKTEMEQWIYEIRSSTVNSRPDLNTTADLFDFSRATNSSGSIHSPENLGSVVDIKLREKENENEKLREEISSIQIDNAKLSKAMNELTATYSKLFDICNENLIVDEENSDPMNCFMIFSNYMQSFASKYEENCFVLNRTKENARQVEDQNLDLVRKLDDIQNQQSSLRKEMDGLLAANKFLTTSKMSLENAVTELEIKLENCLRERSEEENNFKNLRKELECLRTEKLDNERSFEQEIHNLNACLETSKHKLKELQLTNENKVKLLESLECKLKEKSNQNSELLSQIEQLNVEKIEQRSDIEELSCKLKDSLNVIIQNEQKFKELEENKNDFENKILHLEEIKETFSKELDQEKSRNDELGKQTSHLTLELEKSKQNNDSVLKKQMFLLNLTEENKKQIYSLQNKVQTLNEDCYAKTLTISKLKADKESLIDSMQAKINILSNAIDQHEKSLERKTHELDALRQTLLKTEVEFERISSEFRLTKEELNKQAEYIFEVLTDLKTRLGVLLSNNNMKPSSETSDVIDDEQFDNKMMNEVLHLNNDITNIENVYYNLMEENDSLRGRVSNLEYSEKNLKRERSENVLLTEKLVKTEADLREQITSLNSSIKKLEAEVKSVQLLLSNKTQDVVVILEKHNKAEVLITELQAKILGLEIDSALKNKEVENTKLQLEREVADKTKISQDLDTKTKSLMELQIKIEFLETKSTKLRDISNKTADEITKELTSTKIQLENEVTEKLRIREDLERLRLQLESEVADKHETKKHLANMKLQLETEITLKKQTDQYLEQIKLQLQSEVEENQKIKKDFESIKLQFENEVTEKLQIKKDLERAKLELESEVLDKQERRKHLESLKLQLEAEVTQKNQISKHLEQLKLQLEQEKLQIQKDLEYIKLQYENEVTEKQQIKKDLEQARLQLENEVISKQEITKHLESIKLQFESEVSEKHQLENKITEKELQFEDEVEKSKRLLQDLENTKLQLESEILEKRRLETEVTEKIEKINNLLDDLEKSKLQLKSDAIKSRQFKDELDSIKLQEITRINEELEKTQLQLQSEVTEKLKIKDDLEMLKLQLESEVTEKRTIKEDFESLKLQLESEVTEKQKIEQNLSETKLQFENNSSCLKQTQEELEKTKLLLENEVSEKNHLKNDLEKAHTELKELEIKILGLKANNDDAINKTDQYIKQLDDVKRQLENEAIEKEQVKNALEIANKQMDTLSNKREIEKTRLLTEIEALKISSETQIAKYYKDLDEQKENLSRLTQEMALIRKQKELSEEENKALFDKKMSIEENHKLIVEKLQSAEKEVSIKLNSLKTEQIKNQDLENQIKKLKFENAKLKETNDNNMKRIEKQAFQMGDYQAKCQKLKKEADIAQNNLEVLTSSTECTQRENNRLNQECKSLRDKLNKCEITKDQIESRLQSLVKELEQLRDEKKNLENSENDLKTSNVNLEKIKLNLEDKIRKLAKSLSDSNVALNRVEQDKVQLNLEVGGLNKQLQENTQILNMKLIEIKQLTADLIDARNTHSQLVELNEKHQNEVSEIQEDNSRLNDQLSKLSLRLRITEEEHDNAKLELKHLRSDVEASKMERDAIEKDHRTAVERLVGIEELIEERRRTTEAEFVNKIKSLEMQISKMSADYRSLEELRNKEKLINDQLNEDISIFKAKLKKSRAICEENEKKWNEEKELLVAENKESEERVKDTRLELEGKLEKMKNKMKTLYNDEVSKMKKKQERELASLKVDIGVLNTKNEKHEEHIRKLSSQIFRLNENILEYKKENTFLKTKLNDFENKPRQLSRVRGTAGTQSSAHQVLSSNLRMEDEEGEIFNNTYLSDLKNGRLSEHFNTEVSAQELQYRNSMLPPHLKSTYLAQFDHQMGEDEIRDTPNLDDSMSTLLNTGQRKKVSGATSYKRPGPPTPSKNAGRLSFGGIGELNREILKESLDTASGSSYTKTPAKFKLFSSKLSMRGDERKSFVTNFKRKQQIFGVVQCSSTPRKSKAHIDQRRLLDQIMSTASPGTVYSPDCIVKPAVNLPSSLKSLDLNRRVSLYKWRQPKQSYATDSGNSDINSPQLKDARYVSSGSKQRCKRLRDRKGSIYLRGCMFARNCRTPNTGYREVFKKKSKIQRNANFNKHRSEMLKEGFVKRTSFCPDCDEACSNNNNNNDFQLEEIDVNNHAVTDTNSWDEDADDDDNSKHFQQLLAVKKSNAPFDISDINAGGGPSCLHEHNSSSNFNSRTIYGASVILNRKIPNVSTTMVRKSSIYVKGNDGKSVILVTNQTITLKDLAQMWLQMNVSAKSVIAFSFTATLIGILSFVIHVVYR